MFRHEPAFRAGTRRRNLGFPACDACNKSSRAEDKIFGFWAMALNFDSAAMSGAEDRERITQLMTEIAKDYPQDMGGDSSELFLFP